MLKRNAGWQRCAFPALVAGLSFVCSPCFARDTLIANGGFETGDTGKWVTDGTVVSGISRSGAHSLMLSGSASTATTDIPFMPNSMFMFKVYLRGSKDAGLSAKLGIRYLDADHKVIAEFPDDVKPITSDHDNWCLGWFYGQSPCGTVWVEPYVSADTSKSPVYVDDATFDADKVPSHKPLVDLGQYERPFWTSDIQHNETVLMLTDHGAGPATGKLLFTPSEIMSVKSYGLDTTYEAGRDYTISGNTITATPNTRMPVLDSSSLTGLWKWYKLNGKHIVVTYKSKAKWNGPVIRYAGAQLPKTIDKLKKKQPLTIVLLGDSISYGADTSNFDDIPPYMPTWLNLVVDSLKRRTGDAKIRCVNAAVSGSRSAWGATYAPYYAAPLKPDLVIIAYGMNGSPSIADYLNDTKKIMEACPGAEFILVSTMMVEPHYATPDIPRIDQAYEQADYSLEKPGVFVVPMYSISQYLYSQKRSYDCISNPMHPNDYLARWYAQAIVGALTSK